MKFPFPLFHHQSWKRSICSPHPHPFSWAQPFRKRKINLLKKKRGEKRRRLHRRLEPLSFSPPLFLPSQVLHAHTHSGGGGGCRLPSMRGDLSPRLQQPGGILTNFFFVSFSSSPLRKCHRKRVFSSCCCCFLQTDNKNLITFKKKKVGRQSNRRETFFSSLSLLPVLSRTSGKKVLSLPFSPLGRV